MNRLKVIANDQLTLTSVEVAEMVEKKHFHLMRDISGYIEVLEDNPKLDSRQFFIESTYFNTQNKIHPCYKVTKKGCELIAHKLTGKKGILFSVSYIERFHQMEQELKTLNSPSYMIDDPIKRAEKWIQEQKQMQQLSLENEELKPKAQYFDIVLDSTSTYTATQIANELGISSAKALNKILHEKEVQRRVGGQWVLYAKHQGKGYIDTKTFTFDKNDGSRGSNQQLRWTEKGRRFIHGLINAGNNNLQVM